MKVCPICQGRHDDSTACEVDFASQSLESQESEPQIPGFRLDHLLTSAHHAETYRARNVASGRTCLIKVVVADEDAAKQAIREAKIAANLFHPAVANFYDSGRLDDGRCFFVFEDVQGRTLRELIDNSGPPDLLDTVEIIREAAEALHALHRSGIIHGSVTPSRIIMSMTSGEQAIVRVTDPDFGRLEQRSIISNRFLIDNELDSLRYFSPEQCTSDDATVQSDVYSLGVVFYEMLAGCPPFDASTAVGLIQQHANQPPPDIRIANFNLRMLVTHAFTEALQKQTRLRQPSINTLARQLRHIEQLATHSSTPPPAGTGTLESVVTPAVPAAAKIDSRQQTFEQPEILTEVEVLEAELAAVTIATTTALPASRRRVVSIEEALEESDAYLTNLETPPPYRPSRLKSLKEKLQAVTAMFTIERRGGSEAEPAHSATIDDVQLVTTSASRVPKKIEWVQPDEDIPSIDEVREVLATDHDLPLAVSAVEPEVKPITLSARESEIEPVPRTPTKIEWTQPDDDIPSIDAVQEIMALEEMPLPVATFESELEPISLSGQESEIELPLQPEPQIIRVEPLTLASEVVRVEAAPSEPEIIRVESATIDTQEIVVEAPQPEWEVIHVESAATPLLEEFVVESSQPEPEIIRVESATLETQEVVVEALESIPEVVHVDSATSDLEELVVAPQSEPAIIEVEPMLTALEIVAEPTLQLESAKIVSTRIHRAVAAVRKRHKKLSRRQSLELTLEPAEGELEIIPVATAAPEPQQAVVEPLQPELAHVESVTPEPQPVVVEPPQSESKVIRMSAERPARKIAPVPVLRPDAPKGVSALKQFAASAVRKRRKKSSDEQPVELHFEPLRPEPEVVHVEPAVSEPQEVVVERSEPETQVIQVESPVSEPQEVVVESQRPEPEMVHLESAVPEPQEVVVEPQQPEPVVIEVEPVPPAPVMITAPAVRSDFPVQRAVVSKAHKKSSQRRPVVIAKPLSADDEEITVVRARTKRVRIHVKPNAPRSPQRTNRPSQAPSELEFFPTLLGGGLEPTGFTPEQTDGMFAAYSSELARPISRYRSHLIGAGIIALLALFLYGSDLLTGHLGSWFLADTMTAEAIRPAGTNRPPASTTKPIVATPAIDNQVPDNQVAEKPVVDKKDRTAQKTKAPVSSETGTSIPHDSLMKAMIVLPPRAAQVEALSQSDTAQPKRPDGKVVPGQNETRPRVVKDPSP